MRKNLLGFAALVAAAAMLLVPASNAAKPSGPSLLDEPELEQVRLVDVLDRVRLLAECDRERGEPDWAAVELLDERSGPVRGRRVPGRPRALVARRVHEVQRYLERLRSWARVCRPVISDGRAGKARTS